MDAEQIRIDALSRLCEDLGLDCSNCYDAADLKSLIINGFAKKTEDTEEQNSDFRQALKCMTVDSVNFNYYECTFEELVELLNRHDETARDALAAQGEVGK